MRVGIIAVGRMKRGPERDLCDRYLDRLAKSARPLGLEWTGVTELPEAREGSAAARKSAEASAILARLSAGHLHIALDERGEAIGSEAFAQLLARHRDDAARHLMLVIGGPDGLDGSVRDTASATIALGRLTWPHQIVRILLAEQLYRATTILSGHPYHRS